MIYHMFACICDRTCICDCFCSVSLGIVSSFLMSIPLGTPYHYQFLHTWHQYSRKFAAFLLPKKVDSLSEIVSHQVPLRTILQNLFLISPAGLKKIDGPSSWTTSVATIFSSHLIQYIGSFQWIQCLYIFHSIFHPASLMWRNCQ